LELKTPRYYKVVGAQFGPRAEDARIEGYKLVEYPGKLDIIVPKARIFGTRVGGLLESTTIACKER
jgi:hypothetical protein